MLILQDISYTLPDKNRLFDNISLTVKQRDKIALIGNNGSGKSTLLKIIAGELPASGGQIARDAEPYYVPQIFGQFNDLTIGEALKVNGKLTALKEILKGNLTEYNYALLNDDWTIEERCTDALKYWKLSDLDLAQKMATLSGGQKTKVFLAGISIHQAELVLLDEPSNHLDINGRELLYDFVSASDRTLILVSHDRTLLNLLHTVYELSRHVISTYGGNYDFYADQKQVEINALNQDLQSKLKALRKAKEKQRETNERQQKLDSRGKAKQEKAGVAKIMMNTLRNSAENSTSKAKAVHADKVNGIFQEVQELRTALPGIDTMKFNFDNSALHRGKFLFKAGGINYRYHDKQLWNSNLSFEITSGERIALKGLNGSGKTSLINMLLGKLEPQTGAIFRAHNKSVYIDQDYSLIDNRLNVYEQAQQYNISLLEEHEIKIRLNRFLFTKEDWAKPCKALSGGERMRLILCCLTIDNQSPDIIILDEPTNNLDIQNMKILTAAINSYHGTLLVVSHDKYFLEEVRIGRTIELD
jgi:ATPase subunit of ABC transporter with duplicated ATPase domains